MKTNKMRSLLNNFILILIYGISLSYAVYSLYIINTNSDIVNEAGHFPRSVPSSPPPSWLKDNGPDQETTLTIIYDREVYYCSTKNNQLYISSTPIIELDQGQSVSDYHLCYENQTPDEVIVLTAPPEGEIYNQVGGSLP